MWELGTISSRPCSFRYWIEKLAGGVLSQVLDGR